MHPNIFANEILSWMTKIWMQNHLVSDGSWQHFKSLMPKNNVQGTKNLPSSLHLVLVTLHGQFTIGIEQDNWNHRHYMQCLV